MITIGQYPSFNWLLPFYSLEIDIHITMDGIDVFSNRF